MHPERVQTMSSTILIELVCPPLDRPRLGMRVAGTLRRLEAMGLVSPRRIVRLDLAGFVALFDPAAERGIGTDAFLALKCVDENDEETLADLLSALDDALWHSPVPDEEWPRLDRILGRTLLAGLVGVSESTFRRYRSGERPTSPEVADRLHFIAMVVSDLAGAYNDLGVRAWFGRRRKLLDGRAPGELLTGDWHPEEEGPSRVRQLAESLTSAPAT